jgi:hypothetical protein
VSIDNKAVVAGGTMAILSGGLERIGEGIISHPYLGVLGKRRGSPKIEGLSTNLINFLDRS